MTATSKRQHAPPTPEQLATAYRQLYRSPQWPPTLEAALAHRLYGLAVRGVAWNMVRASARKHAADARHPFIGLKPGAFDARRAAANDKDD